MRLKKNREPGPRVTPSVRTYVHAHERFTGHTCTAHLLADVVPQPGIYRGEQIVPEASSRDYCFQFVVDFDRPLIDRECTFNRACMSRTAMRVALPCNPASSRRFSLSLSLFAIRLSPSPALGQSCFALLLRRFCPSHGQSPARSAATGGHLHASLYRQLCLFSSTRGRPSGSRVARCVSILTG